MVKIVRFYEFGEADVLKLEEVSLPQPNKGEIRLKVEAIGLNRAEVLFREGKYIEEPDSFPATLGYEASGTVDAVGEGVTEFTVGDRVSTIPGFSMKKYGVYGESVIVPVAMVAKYPEHLSVQEGAAIWMQYVTAYGALVEYGQIKTGDFVLLSAASGSVGSAAIQITKAQGATAIATTRKASKKQMLLDNGADYVIVTDEEDLSTRIKAITKGQWISFIFDPVAGSLLKTLADVAAKGATIIEYGALSSETTTFPLLPAIAKGLKIQGYTLGEIARDSAKLERAKQYIYDGLDSGSLTPIIDRTFAFEQIVEAHRYMESNQQKGKIVITVP